MSSTPSWPLAAMPAPTGPARWPHAPGTVPAAGARSAKRPACPHKGACGDWTPCEDLDLTHVVAATVVIPAIAYRLDRPVRSSPATV